MQNLQLIIQQQWLEFLISSLKSPLNKYKINKTNIYHFGIFNTEGFLMQFYIPIIIMIVLIVIQCHNGKKGNLFLTILLAISFSILIKFLLWESNYLFLLLYVNFFLYLISLVTYFTRSTM